MPRGMLLLLVLLLISGGLMYFFSTQAEPVPTSVIETNVSDAPAQ